MELMDIVAELKNASVQMPEEKIDQFIEAVDTHERIFVYGTGRSGLMLKALGETTTPSVGKGDLLIVASASGETQSVCSAADDGAKQGTDVLVITGSKESTLSRNHEPLIRIEAATKFSESKASIQPLGSLFEQMLLLIFDAVILKMSSKNADTNKKMAKRHASIE